MEGEMFYILLWTILCFYIGRYNAYIIDKQNSDLGGKPVFVVVPDKWKWLFRFQKNSYVRKNKLLKISVVLCLIGYAFAIIELFLLIYAIIAGVTTIISKMAFLVFIVFMGIFMIIMCGASIRYEYNMSIAYDYDWITYFQEGLVQKSKRRCKVVSQLTEGTYEITFGRYGKRRFRAETDVPVEIGDQKYAVHYYHSLDSDEPFWVIKNY